MTSPFVRISIRDRSSFLLTRGKLMHQQQRSHGLEWALRKLNIQLLGGTAGLVQQRQRVQLAKSAMFKHRRIALLRTNLGFPCRRPMNTQETLVSPPGTIAKRPSSASARTSHTRPQVVSSQEKHSTYESLEVIFRAYVTVALRPRNVGDRDRRARRWGGDVVERDEREAMKGEHYGEVLTANLSTKLS